MRKFELFNASGDGMTFLVEVKDDKKVHTISGDYYHNKIQEYISGYLDGIKEYEEVEVEEYWTDIEDESDFNWEEERNN